MPALVISLALIHIVRGVVDKRLFAATLLAAIPAAVWAQPVAHNRGLDLNAAVKLADWQLHQMHESAVLRAPNHTWDPRTWEQAAFWIGMTSLADAGAPRRIREAIFEMGRSNAWLPGKRPYHADDHAIAQAYLWAAHNGAGRSALAPTRRAFDLVVGRPAVTTLAFYEPPGGHAAPECVKRWCWCDSLFMAPAAFVELSRQTGDDRYRRFALKEFWATTDFLYDPVEHLYYRDSRFFERRDARERKLFWSRGNGWVVGGMARIIPRLPKGSRERKRMEALFVEMANRLQQLQKPDGYWPPSLLASEDSTPETSGTGFFTFGLAWGINAGLLPRRRFEATVRRGWAALNRAIQPDGRLGWVQQVSDQPDKVEAQDTQYYGVGAFLLAAAEIAQLDSAE